MTTSNQQRSKYVAVADESGFVGLGEGPDEDGVRIDPRDQGQVQNLISFARMGATDMNVGLGRLLPGTTHIKHHHPYGSEFYLFTKGRCVMHIDGVDVDAGPGTAIYIPAGAVHGMRNDSEETVELVYGLSKGDYTDIGLVYDE
jgi:quercetin dioxygenase-like cupin family protein